MLLLTIAHSIAEEERRARANDREYNEKFQYAVSVPCFRAGRGLGNPRLRPVAGWEGCLGEAGNIPSATRLKFSGFLPLKQNPWT